MKFIIEKTKELSRKYNGLQMTRVLFPEEYCRLDANLILNDDALEQIDTKLINLLNKYCFPCCDTCYNFYEKTRERPYLGLDQISIYPMSFDSYRFPDYYSDEGSSWYFVYVTSDKSFSYYGYDYSAINLIEQIISRLPNSHPLTILPDVVRYVWAMTGNLWLDSHIEEEDNQYYLDEAEVLRLEKEYAQALVKLVELSFFDQWFTANYATAQPAIARVFSQITIS